MIERGLRTNITYHDLVVNAFDRRIKQMRQVLDEATKVARAVYTIGVDPIFWKAQELHVPAQMIIGSKGMKELTRVELRRIAKGVITGAPMDERAEHRAMKMMELMKPPKLPPGWLGWDDDGTR